MNDSDTENLWNFEMLSDEPQGEHVGVAVLPAAPARRQVRQSFDRPACGDRRQTVQQPGAEGPSECLWVAELQGRIVGMIGLGFEGPHVVHVRRFRIEPDWQHTRILARLIGRLYRFCRERGCLKVVIEAGTIPGWVLRVLGRRGFQFTRTTGPAGKEVLEFYVDLYLEPRE